jgi:hypothetical protein
MWKKPRRVAATLSFFFSFRYGDAMLTAMVALAVGGKKQAAIEAATAEFVLQRRGSHDRADRCRDGRRARRRE